MYPTQQKQSQNRYCTPRCFGSGKWFHIWRRRGKRLSQVVFRPYILAISLLSFCTVSFLSPASIPVFKRWLEVRTDQLSINAADASLYLEPPLSSIRPRYQFVGYDVFSRSRFFKGRPSFETKVFSVFTFIKRPSPKLMDTAYTILNQSLRDFRWIIFHSCLGEKSCLAEVEKLALLDERIVTIESSGSMDVDSRYKSIISELYLRPSRFFTFLEEGDLFELTALEKAAWVFVSNKNVSYVSTYVKEFEMINSAWENGFQGEISPLDVGQDNRSSWIMGRTSALVNKTYESASGEVQTEDQSILRCLQFSEGCGVTIPEVLRWSRSDVAKSTGYERNSSMQISLESTEGERSKTCSPQELPAPSEDDGLDLSAPFRNDLQMKSGILFILPWMDIGGADISNLNIVQEFSRRGYRVTVVCSLLMAHGSSRATEPLFMKYTHDIFTLPSIIRLADAAQFLSYIIESRGIDLVLLSNSELGYSLLPWLSYRRKSVRFVDYVHNEEPTWKGGGYPFMSVKSQGHLDMTFASSISAINFMMERGKERQRVQLGHLGIRLDHLKPFDNERRADIRGRLGIPPNTILISFIGRMVFVKQPMVVLKAFLQVAETLREENADNEDKIRIHLLLAGEGEGRKEVELETVGHSEFVTMRPSANHATAIEYIGASDIFCLPSLSEGISFATAEAMALGVAPITSNIGGLPELIGENGHAGLMFTPTGDEERDVLGMVKCIEKLVRNDEWRKAVQKRAARRVRSMFDASVEVPRLVSRMLRTKKRRNIPKKVKMRRTLLGQFRKHLRMSGPISDFTQIQTALGSKRRDGYGAEYQRKCGEYGGPWTQVIDALEIGASCVGYTLDVDALRASALSQCGQWDIRNVRDPSGVMGWLLSEECGGFIPTAF